MAIPENQLDTWAAQGSVSQSQGTYEILRKALDKSTAPYASRDYVSYLQGSYGNDTNIYADSDVDVVMQLNSTFYKDISNMSSDDQETYQTNFSNASYSLADFRREVIAHIEYEFGSNVKPGGKAIFVQGDGRRRDADILVCAQYRKYRYFKGAYNQSYVEGVTFWSSDGTQIINYPKVHSENCTAKHQSTNSWFKPTVRTFKNMRNRMIDDGYIKEGLAPSYFLEGMLYNVPSTQFGVSYADTVANSINWLRSTDRAKLLCANEQYYLLNEFSPVTWRAANCTSFLDAAVKFWNDWQR